MSRRLNTGKRLLPILLATVILVLLGCDEKSRTHKPIEQYQLIQLGFYISDDKSDRGAIMLDLDFAGAELTGQAVIRSRAHEDPFLHVYLRGSRVGDEIQLGLDTEKIPYQYELTILATMGPADDLAGTLSYPAGGLEAEFEAAPLETAEVTVEDFVDLDVSAIGMAFDGEDIWVSTATRDYILMDLEGALVDTITVFIRENTHWTSDALTSDGTSLWGHLPVSINNGGEVRNESDIEKFTKEGVIIDTFRIAHRTSGLANDGQYLWSLSANSDSLFRFDGQGTVHDGIEIQVPDLVDIEYDGNCFWAIGWFMKRLYKIDSTGTVVRVYHLPGEGGTIFPSSIVFDGEHFWYVFGTTYLDSRIYKLTVGF